MVLFKIFIGIYLFFSLSVSASESSQKIVAFAQDTMSNDFRKAQVFEVRDELSKHPEIQFVYSDANSKTSLLIYQIQKYINMNVDVLIVGTNDEKAVVPVIKQAYEKGIAVIILDRGIEGDAYTTFINSDNIKIGKIGAEYIAQRLEGKGTVLLFEGLQKADVTKERTKGFKQEMSKYKDIKVITRVGNYLRKDAIAQTQKLIEDGIHLDAIFSQSDSMLSGFRLAYKHNNKDNKSIVSVGCDYTSEAHEAIKASEQSASVRFPLGGRESALVALEILSKKEVPKHILIPVQLVTKENVTKVEPIF
jgi:ribose transport system substrate-binding protein